MNTDTEKIDTPLTAQSSRKVLVILLAYNAAKTIESVLWRVPKEMGQYDTEVLVLDDASVDGTFDAAKAFQEREVGYPFKLTVLTNPVNQNIGGNIKIGFRYAIRNGFDVACLIHGDGQYAPEELPRLARPIADGNADVVFGSRMMEGFRALKGGMPLYKFVGNKILTWMENRLLGTELSEFHTGLRLYAVDLLKKIPFELNSNDFHFETEIIFQVHYANCRFQEHPIPTFYGDEISHVNGLKYAWNVAQQAVLGRAQRLGLCYQKKFDIGENLTNSAYRIPTKTVLNETHLAALARVPDNARVLDVAAATGAAAGPLKDRGCSVVGIDTAPPPDDATLDGFTVCDLDDDPIPNDLAEFDAVLLFDVVNHLHVPEQFLEHLHEKTSRNLDIRIFVTSGNIGFVLNRLQLLLGYFNYGKRGILAPSHTRLLTFASAQRLFEEAGFTITHVDAAPAPFRLVFGDNGGSRLLTSVNKFLMHVSWGLFGYGIMLEIRPQPTVDYLLDAALGLKPADGLKHDSSGPRRRERSK